MGLKTAANYFVRTPIYGWNGTAWVNTGAKGALDPYDRFVSEREFGLKRRMLLVNPDNPIPEQYTTIRIGQTGPIYLLGWMNEDIYADQPYSLIYLICIANEICQIVRLQKQTKASGMGSTVVDVPVGTFHCVTERVTFNNSPEFTQLRVTDATITLPIDCQISEDYEVIVGSKRYVVQEEYKTAGFRQVRCQVKNV